MATQSVAQLALPYEGQARAIEMAMRDFHAQHLGVGIKAQSVAGVYSPFTAEFDDFFADTIRRYILMDAPDPALKRQALDGITDAQREAIKFIKPIYEAIGEDATHYGLFLDTAAMKKRLRFFKTESTRRPRLLQTLNRSVALMAHCL